MKSAKFTLKRNGKPQLVDLKFDNNICINILPTDEFLSAFEKAMEIV